MKSKCTFYYTFLVLSFERQKKKAWHLSSQCNFTELYTEDAYFCLITKLFFNSYIYSTVQNMQPNNLLVIRLTAQSD